MIEKRILHGIGFVVAAMFLATAALAQTPSPTLLVLSKSDSTVAIVDPATLQVLTRVPSGPDPHEIVASDDGKLAYISNYGGLDSTLNTISVVDLVAQKALPPTSARCVPRTASRSRAAKSISPPRRTRSSDATIPRPSVWTGSSALARIALT